MNHQDKETRANRDAHAPVFLENTDGNGVVVFIHGYMGSPRQFDRLVKVVHRHVPICNQ